MRKIFLLFFVMLVITFSVKAQNRTITGTVTSKTDNEALIGVTIGVKGSTTATSTDINGKYSIKVTNLQNVVITAKYIGFEYQEVTIKPGQTVVDFKLSSSAKDLAEVAIVAVGYGTQLKAKLLGAVSEIKASDVEDLPVANLGTALKNRLPGIGVDIASGKPGAPTTINIRNSQVLSNVSGLGLTAEPLYVIDGLIATSTDFNNLDASLVESISFLKDSQAAIYGAAGDKGVVLVTTKKGKPGKARISYSGYYGNSNTAVQSKFLSAYQQAKMLNDGFELTNSLPTARFSQADLDYLATNPVKSWYDELWHSSDLTRHTINVSGGTEKITFFGGGSYYSEGGNYGNISIKKYAIRSGMTAKVSDEVTAYISLNTDYSIDNRNTNKNSGTGTEDQFTNAILATPKWTPLTINGLPIAYTVTSSSNLNVNPIGLFNSGDYETNNGTGVNLNSSIEYRPKYFKGFTAKVQFGKTNRSGTAKQYFPPYTVYNFIRTGQNGLLYQSTALNTSTPTSKYNNDRIVEGTNYANSYQINGSVDYARTIGKHTFDVLFVTEQSESNSDTYLVYRDGQQLPGVDQFFAFNPSTTTVQLGTPLEAGKLSYLTRINYDYAGKYLFQFIARRDGSASFPPDKRWGIFPSAGLGWRVSEERFFKDNVKFVSTLKLRANVGLVGDDRIQGYQYQALYKQQPNGYLFGTTLVNGLDFNLIPNTNITWEKALTQNYGFDISFLNGALTLSADFYNKHTYDAFQNLGDSTIPFTLGANTALVNYPVQNSWGSEFTIGYAGNINKDWNFNVNLFTGFSNSQITQIYYSSGVLGTATEAQNVRLGQYANAYNNNFGYIAKGIIRTQAQLDAILAANPNYKIGGAKPQLGFMDYVDVNGDGVIEDKDITTMFDGGVTPALSGGFTVGVGYKTFKLNVNGNFVIGGKTFVDGSARRVPTTTVNAAAFWDDHWTPSNPDAKYPRADAPLAKETSTFWARSATAMRINNLSLSYGLPRSIADRLKIPDLRILVSGTNLWNIINPFDYKDPNTGNINAYPTLRTFSVGLNVTL